MAKKRILVACGTAIATSTVVANKIKELLAKKGITEVTIEQCKAAEAPSKAANFDLIVTTTPVEDTGNTPVIRTVSFLSGVGVDKDIALIMEKLGV
jgi:PTS system galactitol-specific IIB component